MKNPRTMQYVNVRHSGKGVAQDILEYAKENSCDMISIGTDAARLRRNQTYLGSVAGKLVCTVPTDMPLIIAHYDDMFKTVMTPGSKDLLKMPMFPHIPKSTSDHVPRAYTPAS